MMIHGLFNSPLSRLAGLFAFMLLLASCATQEPPPIVQQPQAVVRAPEPPPPPPPAPKKPAGALRCEENTSAYLNRSGIDAIPFMRMFFADVDGDGLEDMVVGDKTGAVTLYKNAAAYRNGEWRKAGDYFNGVKVGAASSPVLADLDGDGKAELIVGTGGFSSESGKVLLYRNEGTPARPSWRSIPGGLPSVGNDAAVTAVDYNGDGRTDLIVGNSEGSIFFYRSSAPKGSIGFSRDSSPLGKRRFGMYAVPAAAKINGKIILVIGNDMGKLYRFDLERANGGIKASEKKAGLSTKTFAAPAFARLVDPGRADLAVADGDGIIIYYENQKGDLSALKRRDEIFGERLLAGPACSPAITVVDDRTCMVVGNMDGTLKLFEYRDGGKGLPWVEQPDYFSGVKVAGYSRGALTTFGGHEVLITGQGNGTFKAFFNAGTKKKPVWKERTHFFRGVTVPQHSTPIVFDLDEDGQWELISGAADGRIYVFGIRGSGKIEPSWDRLSGSFDDIRVGGFSAPSISKHDKNVYLFVGQKDGHVRAFRAELAEGKQDWKSWRFREETMPGGTKTDGQSSPFVSASGGKVELLLGDYSGNLRQFVCR